MRVFDPPGDSLGVDAADSQVYFVSGCDMRGVGNGEGVKTWLRVDLRGVNGIVMDQRSDVEKRRREVVVCVCIEINTVLSNSYEHNKQHDKSRLKNAPLLSHNFLSSNGTSQPTFGPLNVLSIFPATFSRHK